MTVERMVLSESFFGKAFVSCSSGFCIDGSSLGTSNLRVGLVGGTSCGTLLAGLVGGTSCGTSNLRVGLVGMSCSIPLVVLKCTVIT